MLSLILCSALSTSPVSEAEMLVDPPPPAPAVEEPAAPAPVEEEPAPDPEILLAQAVDALWPHLSVPMKYNAQQLFALHAKVAVQIESGDLDALSLQCYFEDDAQACRRASDFLLVGVPYPEPSRAVAFAREACELDAGCSRWRSLTVQLLSDTRLHADGERELAKMCVADDPVACGALATAPEGAWVSVLQQHCEVDDSVPACTVLVSREFEGDIGWSDRRAGILWLAVGTPLMAAVTFVPALYASAAAWFASGGCFFCGRRDFTKPDVAMAVTFIAIMGVPTLAALVTGTVYLVRGFYKRNRARGLGTGLAAAPQEPELSFLPALFETGPSRSTAPGMVLTLRF